MPMPPLSLGLIIASLGLMADQLSKWLIVTKIMNPPQILPLLPVLDLTLVYNRGVSFGFLSQSTSQGVWGLLLLTSIITGLMLYWLIKSKSRLEAISLGLIIGGALGNIIDRLQSGAVIDFIHCHWQNFSFPAFNFADSWITIGAILLVVEQLLQKKESHHVSSHSP